MPQLRQRILHAIASLRSPRGRDTGMFLIFLIISAILWCVLSLNEEDQQDLRLPLKITHVPDSVTMISTGPEALNVSLRTKGTQLLKMKFGSTPSVNIDFRAYRSNGTVHLSSADLKALVRNSTGGAQVNVVYPDSLTLPYTTHPGFKVPVTVDYKASAGIQSSIKGRPRLSTDSVYVYVANGTQLPDRFNSITTEPINLPGLSETTTRRVRLKGPAGSRVIPDSVDVTIEVEPMIFKTRKVAIEPVNVPEGTKLITFPAQVDVSFMVPVSDYTNNDTRFRVLADYRKIRRGSKMVALSLSDVPQMLQNVHMSADSAEYIIERH